MLFHAHSSVDESACAPLPDAIPGARKLHEAICPEATLVQFSMAQAWLCSTFQTYGEHKYVDAKFLKLVFFCTKAAFTRHVPGSTVSTPL